MSRAGYSEYCYDNWQHIMWRGQVMSSIRGKRGQKFLRDLIAALEAMPEKKLIRSSLQDGDNVCAIGALGIARGIDMADDKIDPYDPEEIAKAFDVAAPLVREIEYYNDDMYISQAPEERWKRMHAWAKSYLKAPTAEQEG